MTPPPFKEVKCLSKLRIYLLASYFLHLATREAAAVAVAAALARHRVPIFDICLFCKYYY